mgnify:CR=1 FL=1
MGLNDKAPVPIYYQIKEEILEKILSGELNPEDKLRFAGEAARASSARDGAVAKLGLPGGGPDPYARVMAEEDG